jgi:hypothetical protein
MVIYKCITLQCDTFRLLLRKSVADGSAGFLGLFYSVFFLQTWNFNKPNFALPHKFL